MKSLNDGRLSTKIPQGNLLESWNQQSSILGLAAKTEGESTNKTYLLIWNHLTTSNNFYHNHTFSGATSSPASNPRSPKGFRRQLVRPCIENCEFDGNPQYHEDEVSLTKETSCLYHIRLRKLRK